MKFANIHSSKYEKQTVIRKFNSVLLISFSLAILIGCQEKKETTAKKMLTQADFPSPPVAEKIPTKFNDFGKERIDDYYWIGR